MARKSRRVQWGWPTLLLCLLLASCVQAAPLTLDWTNPPDDTATFLEIHRKAEPCASSGQSFTLLDTIPQPVTSDVDPTPVDGALYCYRVRSGNNDGVSAFSNDAEKPLAGSPAAASNLVVSGSAVMAIAFVQFVNGTEGASPTTAVFGSNVTAGSLLIVGGRISTAGVTLGVSDSQGNTWFEVAKQDITPDGDVTFLWAAYNAAGGANTVTITSSAGTITPMAAEYSGLATASALDKTAKAEGNSTSADSGATATTAQADELVVGVVGTQSGGNPASGAGFTQRTQHSGRAMLEDKTVSATGTYNATGTLNSAPWAAIVATFKAAVVVTDIGAQYQRIGATGRHVYGQGPVRSR